MAEASRQKFVDTFKELLDSGAFSDLTVTCGADTYKVHKAIVCARADFFARAIKFGGKEAEEGKIELPEDDPAIIKLLMAYIYEGEYDPILQPVSRLSPAGGPQMPIAKGGGVMGSIKSAKPKPPFPHTCLRRGIFDPCNDRLCRHHTCNFDCHSDCSHFSCEECRPPVPDQLLTHAKMYEIADKYDVVGLKDLVMEKFCKACQYFWDAPAFAAAARHAFSTTPEHDKGLRNIVSKTISNHMTELVKKPEVEALLTELNGLAFELLKMKTEAGWK